MLQLKRGLKVTQPNQYRHWLAGRAKYILTIVNLPKDRKHAGKCACFIIPQSREHEWSYSSQNGRAELAKQINYSRVIFVELGRGYQFGGAFLSSFPSHHSYWTDLQSIQDEISPKIKELSDVRLSLPVRLILSSIRGKSPSWPLVMELASVMSYANEPAK